jgi:hypothetical protein
LATIYVYSSWSFCLFVLASQVVIDISIWFLKWFCNHYLFFNLSSKWGKGTCIHMCLCIYAYVYISMCVHVCVYICA